MSNILAEITLKNIRTEYNGYKKFVTHIRIQLLQKLNMYVLPAVAL